MRRTRSAADLRAIAAYHKVLILWLVAQLLIWVGYVGAILTELARDNGEAAVLLLWFTALIGLVAAVFVVLLEAKLSGPVLGVFLGLLTVVPCLGLVILLVVSVRATGALRENGVRVGLFGARVRDIDELPEGRDEEDSDDRPRRRRRDPYAVNEDEGW
jgi:hypothetical protein